MTTDSVDGRPRPQLWRTSARSLDGTWDFAADPRGTWNEPSAVEWSGRIHVPFSPGTPASGVTEDEPGLAWWYRRTFVLPDGDGDGDRDHVIHLGAVDHVADVWVDGHHIISDESGYTPVRARLRGALASRGEHELVVRATDDPFDLSKPRGKQTWNLEPHSIWYPRTSGIWQPTWIEPLGRSSIDSLWWQPDVIHSALGLQLRVVDPIEGCRLAVRLTVGDRVVADDSFALNGRRMIERSIVVDRGAGDLEIDDVLWSPWRPNLIDAQLTLVGPDGEILDEVESYAGLRSVGIDRGRLLLNGRPYRHRLVLDQGYWPESGMTAPSDEALRRDVELTKQLGFNGVRKHQKVEDPRYLYWADRLGLMVWGELPSAYRFDDVAMRRALRVWPDVIVRDRSHPCIVGWIPINESWGVLEVADRPDQRAYVRALVDTAHALDPSRPVIANDGWENVGGDIVAVHDYDTNPPSLQARWESAESIDAEMRGFGRMRRRILLQGGVEDRPLLLSEFGGISLGETGWGYEVVESTEAFAVRYEQLLAAVRASPHLAGFCYTQLTDTYQESNGLLRADRTPKVPLERLRAATRGSGEP